MKIIAYIMNMDIPWERPHPGIDNIPGIFLKNGKLRSNVEHLRRSTFLKNGKLRRNRRIRMANIISDETIEYVGILAKLELSDEEKEQAKKDMGSMLDYIDKLNELDTTGVEPMSHVFPVKNVFREDVVTNSDDRDRILTNAPAMKDGSFKVPKTVD